MPMPQPAIGLLKEDDHDSRMELILRRLGYQVFSYTRCHLMLSALNGHGAGMALVNRALTKKEAQLIKTYRQKKTADPAAVVLCQPEGMAQLEADCEFLADPFNIPTLHQALQRHLTQYDRKKLRASIRLPALVCDRSENLIGEVNVLGTGGAQLLSATRPLHKGQNFDVVIPLLGQKKELEIPCQVVYAQDPGSENNFQFLAGVEFLNPGDDITGELESYLSNHLLSAPDDNGYYYQQLFTPPPQIEPAAVPQDIPDAANIQ